MSIRPLERKPAFGYNNNIITSQVLAGGCAMIVCNVCVLFYNIDNGTYNKKNSLTRTQQMSAHAPPSSHTWHTPN